MQDFVVLKSIVYFWNWLFCSFEIDIFLKTLRPRFSIETVSRKARFDFSQISRFLFVCVYVCSISNCLCFCSCLLCISLYLHVLTICFSYLLFVCIDRRRRAFLKQPEVVLWWEIIDFLVQYFILMVVLIEFLLKSGYCLKG